jgi:hypothetical protein
VKPFCLLLVLRDVENEVGDEEVEKSPPVTCYLSIPDSRAAVRRAHRKGGALDDNQKRQGCIGFAPALLAVAK